MGELHDHLAEVAMSQTGYNHEQAFASLILAAKAVARDNRLPPRQMVQLAARIIDESS
ncbi:hypothetical protein [Gymnodinialimonas sp.]